MWPLVSILSRSGTADELLDILSGRPCFPCDLTFLYSQTGWPKGRTRDAPDGLTLAEHTRRAVRAEPAVAAWSGGAIGAAWLASLAVRLIG